GFYLEAGTGIRLLSRSRVSGRELSTEFHFGSHGGAGIRFGPGNRLDAALMLQHISNADIETPNPGINFYQLRLIYRLGGSP
ncbi:MAG: acyloxyacyl hydrolase, partial [Pseudomonadota bacterium]